MIYDLRSSDDYIQTSIIILTDKLWKYDKHTYNLQSSVFNS